MHAAHTCRRNDRLSRAWGSNAARGTFNAQDHAALCTRTLLRVYAPRAITFVDVVVLGRQLARDLQSISRAVARPELIRGCHAA